MKRPPPPFPQTGVNGVKAQHSSSPQPASKQLPGSNHSTPASSTGPPIMNGANGAVDSKGGPGKGPLNKSKKDAQKANDPAARIPKHLVKPLSTDTERRLGKKCPEPYGETSQCCVLRYPCLLTLALLVKSQNNFLYPKEILKMSAIPYRTPTSDTFPFRAAGRKLPLQF